MTDIYYDNLAAYYKFIYADWESSVQRQAQILDSVIREFVGESAITVLDAACGIGTQSIGLAKLGYSVTGSDLSPVEVERAHKEAATYGVPNNFYTVDMRTVWDFYQKQFDVVIACDNSIPHLLTEEEILKAFHQFYKCTKSGGVCILSVRDYSKISRGGKRKQIFPRQIHQIPEGMIILVDVWDFDDDIYEITTYIVEDIGRADAQTKIIRGGKYYCVEIPTLERLLLETGFQDVRVLPNRFFQPLIIAVK